MKNVLTYILLLLSVTVVAQDKTEEKAALKQKLKAQSFVAEANDLAANDAFVEAEMEYRKALSIKPTQVAGAYNLGHQYIKKGNFEEALYRNQQAAKNATTKEEKHNAFHNMGNILMEEKKCKEAVEAYKSALRSDPSDDETRYNFALAKACAKQQEDDNPQDDDKDGENNKDKDDSKDKDKDKEQEDNKDKDQQDKEDQGDKDKKDGDQDKDEEGAPKDDKESDPKEGDKENQQNQPQPGQMSPQQIKNLLEAMNNQEQKVQEKINAQKVKGAKQQTDKDW
ncbi:aerotolerance regulator BatC [Olleya sp. 1-3]|uniref:aerotolerance regulator BatC n=1 Tax=Olleya sp. 1-3 TaxID=2058323 RepID=UPI000C32EC1A|nr:aerotolerance regulator BatC [Olleya sp. 1-3]PKG53519.1 aerotolerance regulator BatC [Olleya sp. 1-3]